MCDGHDHEPEGDVRRRRLPFASFVTNWRSYDASFGSKVRLALRNNWIKLATRSRCCGNDGQPGC